MTKKIIKYYNLLSIGCNLDIDSLSPEEAYYLEFYGINAKAKEKNEDFKILAEMLNKCFGGK